MLVKLDHFPSDRGEDKTRLKPPPTFDVALQTNYMDFMHLLYFLRRAVQ